jgi:mono/diheme cytochrome c family protein
MRTPRATAILLVFGMACQDSGGNREPPISAAPAEARSDALLLAATKIALPPPGIAPGDLPDPGSPGAELLARYCAQCHEIPTPVMHSATDWPRVLRRMWLRMDRLPDSLLVRDANEGERGTLLSYLTTNALRVSGAELPPGRGREDFAVVCSRCHALPDIRIHSGADWPSVFARMERNMERMNVSQPDPEQTSRILLYLQDAAAP